MTHISTASAAHRIHPPGNTGAIDALGDSIARTIRAHSSGVVAATLLLYLAAAITLSWVRLPQRDEGQLASAAYELAYHHQLAMPMWTPWIPTMDHHVYATMPLYYVQLAPWVRLFGASIRAVRVNTVLWGAVFVLGWSLVIRRISDDGVTGLLGLMLLAFNYDVINLTSARYDPMCAGLVAIGLALYLWGRVRLLVPAVAAANTCLAAALLTHPFGATGALAFVALFVSLDRRRLSLAVISAAAVPYVVGFGAWGLYILQDPSAFHSQMQANAPGRLISFAHPLEAFAVEIRNRYLVNYAGWRSDVPLLMRTKVIFLLAYAAGIVGAVASPRLRRRPGVMALAAAAIGSALLIMVADSLQRYVYLIYVLPMLIAVLACWLRDVSRGRRVLQLAIAGCVVASLLFTAATLALRVRIDDYDRLYQPTLTFLQSHVRPGDLVVGGGEFGPGLGFADHVLEDSKLGYEIHRRPAWIVFDKSQDDWLDTYARTEPAVAEYATRLMAGYQLVFSREDPYNYYRVYHAGDDRGPRERASR